MTQPLIFITQRVLGSSVGIAACYEFAGPGSNPGGERDFHFSLSALLPNGYRVSLPGLNRPEHGVDLSPTSSAEVK
jgi:hypothetical protein